MYLLFKNYSLSKLNFFLWNTNSTNRKGKNKQKKHKHTKHSKKDNIGKG